MSIDKDIKVTINLNKIVEERIIKMMGYINFGDRAINGNLISNSDIDKIAINARSQINLNELFDSIDTLIFDHLGIPKPSINEMVHGVHYGEIQPEPGREAYLTKLESDAKKRKAYFKKNFDLVDLSGGSWTLQVPLRKE